MRMLGHCSTCHRPRQVRVSGHALAMASATHGIPQGVGRLQGGESHYKPTERG